MREFIIKGQKILISENTTTQDLEQALRAIVMYNTGYSYLDIAKELHMEEYEIQIPKDNSPISEEMFDELFRSLTRPFTELDASCRLIKHLHISKVSAPWEVVVLESVYQIPDANRWSNVSMKELTDVLKDLNLSFGMKFFEEQLARLKAATTEKK